MSLLEPSVHHGSQKDGKFWAARPRPRAQPWSVGSAPSWPHRLRVMENWQHSGKGRGEQAPFHPDNVESTSLGFHPEVGKPETRCLDAYFSPAPRTKGTEGDLSCFSQWRSFWPHTKWNFRGSWTVEILRNLAWREETSYDMVIMSSFEAHLRPYSVTVLQEDKRKKISHCLILSYPWALKTSTHIQAPIIFRLSGATIN